MDPGNRGKTESVDHSILQLLEDPASKEVQQLDLEWFQPEIHSFDLELEQPEIKD